MNISQVIPNKQYPHQTVSLSPIRWRRRIDRFHCSSSNKELELIESGDLRSSEEEELGCVEFVGFRESGEEGFGDVVEGGGIEETWRCERPFLRFRAFISRDGILPYDVIASLVVWTLVEFEFQNAD